MVICEKENAKIFVSGGQDRLLFQSDTPPPPNETIKSHFICPVMKIKRSLNEKNVGRFEEIGPKGKILN